MTDLTLTSHSKLAPRFDSCLNYGQGILLPFEPQKNLPEQS